MLHEEIGQQLCILIAANEQGDITEGVSALPQFMDSGQRVFKDIFGVLGRAVFFAFWQVQEVYAHLSFTGVSDLRLLTYLVLGIYALVCLLG